MADNTHISIPRERYLELLAAEDHLNKLFELGVDNWQGYEGPDEIKPEEINVDGSWYHQD